MSALHAAYAGTPLRGFRADALVEHAELAGLLFTMREALVGAVHVDLQGLVRLDERIDAQLDGLRLAAEEGYAVAREGLRAGRAGSFFVLTVLSVELRHDDHASQLAAAAEVNPTARREFSAGLDWVPRRRIEPWARAFLTGSARADRAAALFALGAHRLPLDTMTGVIDDMRGDALPHRRALVYRALGDAGGEVNSATIGAGLADPSPEVRLEALWAAMRKAPTHPNADAFFAAAAEAPDLAPRALTLAAHARSAGSAWPAPLPSAEPWARAEILAIAAAGWPRLLPRLLPHSRVAATARWAAWAYAAVTGCDLLGEGLARKIPPPPGAGPNDDPRSSRVDVPPEHHVPWPSAESIDAHCQRWVATAEGGARYARGKPITREEMQAILASGAQPQRALAALELALLEPNAPLFSTTAPGFRQRALVRG
jgi:uncharacterized protein (TIGR02270 family)